MASGKEIILWKDDIQGITYYRRKGTKKPIIYAYFSVNGKRHRLSTKTTDSKQAAIIAQEKYALACGGEEVRTVTFSQAAKEFLANKKHRVQKSTYDNYKVILGYVEQLLGDIDIRKINDKTIAELEEWRRTYYTKNPKKIIQKYKRNGKTIKNGRTFNKTVSNRTINLTIGLTLSVLRHASDMGHIKNSLTDIALEVLFSDLGPCRCKDK